MGSNCYLSLIVNFNYLYGGYKGHGARFFFKMCSKKTRGSSHKLQQRKVQL